jgi:hypothetical protein
MPQICNELTSKAFGYFKHFFIIFSATYAVVVTRLFNFPNAKVAKISLATHASSMHVPSAAYAVKKEERECDSNMVSSFFGCYICGIVYSPILLVKCMGGQVQHCKTHCTL